MDVDFTPIFVILLITLIIECLSLLLQDFGMALCARLVIFLLLYLTFVIKRSITTRELLHRNRKLLHFHSYIILCITVTTILLHLIMFAFLPFRLYSTLVILLSLPITLDEYIELHWLQTVQSLYREQSNCSSDNEEDVGIFINVELRASIFYTLFKTFRNAIRITYEKEEGII